jgi:hypothetical protein
MPTNSSLTNGLTRAKALPGQLSIILVNEYRDGRTMLCCYSGCCTMAGNKYRRPLAFNLRTCRDRGVGRGSAFRSVVRLSDLLSVVSQGEGGSSCAGPIEYVRCSDSGCRSICYRI